MSAWAMVKLGQVADFINGDRGKNYPSEGDFVDTGVPFINAGHLTNGDVDFCNMNYIRESRFDLLGSGKTRQNDILYCLRGSLGKTAIVRENGNAAIASSLVIIRPSDNCSVNYLYHFLISPLGQGEVRKFDNGSSQPNLSANSVKNYLLPLPPLAEQRRIAEVMDRAEALRAKRRTALAQLDSLTQSIFFDLFGDPVSNSRKWPQEDLETFFYFKTGKLDSNAAVATGQYPFFTCSREDYRIDTYAFDCEALLLAGNNASADYSVKHYKGKFNAYQRTYVITLRHEHNSYDYARFVLEQRLAELKRISKGTNTKYLTMELLNRIRIPVPPQELQREFARRVQAVEKLKTAQRASLAEMDALFASLQHRAFRGEL